MWGSFGKSLSKTLASRWTSWCIMATTFIVALVFVKEPEGRYIPATGGLVFDNLQWGRVSPIAAIFFNTAVYLVVALIFQHINRRYKIVKSTSWYFFGLFFLILTAFPELYQQVNQATITALVLSFCILLLFTTYSEPLKTSTTFLIFFLLSCASTVFTSITFYIPVFFAGLWYMKTLTVRSILAAILGLVTPYWIIWGFEWAPPFRFNVPIVHYDYFEFISNAQIAFIVTSGVLCLSALIFLIGSIIRSMAYNTLRRACNGFISLAAIVTVILIAADATNLTAYIPFMAILTAFMANHYLYAKGQCDKPVQLLSLPVLFTGLIIWNFLSY